MPLVPGCSVDCQFPCVLGIHPSCDRDILVKPGSYVIIQLPSLLSFSCTLYPIKRFILSLFPPLLVFLFNLLHCLLLGIILLSTAVIFTCKSKSKAKSPYMYLLSLIALNFWVFEIIFLVRKTFYQTS